MGAIGFRLRRRLTRRLAGAIVMLVLIGLLGGVALATVVGARRNATAYRRLLAYSRTYDVLVNPDLGSQSALDAAAVAKLPEVRAASRLDGYFAIPDGLDAQT